MRLGGRTRGQVMQEVGRTLVREMVYELVPLKNVEQAIAELPPGARVSVTCSPVKGIAATQELTDKIRASGHEVIPHVSARLVEDQYQVALLAKWLAGEGIREVFVVAGDAESPVGPYEGALPFLRDLLDLDPGLRHVGVAAYPDGHALIDEAVVIEALHAKQALLAAAGVSGSATTQMCFDAGLLRRWVRAERDRGLSLPIVLGIPGVVDRTKLMTMGARLGVGASLRFLAKNRSSVTRLIAPGGYDPTDLVADLSADAESLGIIGLHSFTFNSVADTAAWQHRVVSGDSNLG